MPLFLTALFCFGWGAWKLVHLSGHLFVPACHSALTAPEIGKAVICGAVLLTAGLALTVQFFRKRISYGLFTFIFVLSLSATIWARPGRTDCDEVERRLDEAGVAYDAREGFFGRTKMDEPSGDRFSPDSKQLTWYGSFNKPFEYWGSPELDATWFDPEGQVAAVVEVDTEKCKLATARLRGEGFRPGMWRVDVNCEDGRLIDSRQIPVGQPPAVPQDVQIVADEPVQIDV